MQANSSSTNCLPLAGLPGDILEGLRVVLGGLGHNGRLPLREGLDTVEVLVVRIQIATLLEEELAVSEPHTAEANRGQLRQQVPEVLGRRRCGRIAVFRLNHYCSVGSPIQQAEVANEA
jgi:hypothetical protein